MSSTASSRQNPRNLQPDRRAFLKGSSAAAAAAAAALTGAALPLTSAAQDKPAQQAPAPFYYKGTDSNPPAGAVAYPMTPHNQAPALVVWLFLTTNPDWIKLVAQDKENQYMRTVPQIAAAVGLTEGTVHFILNRVKNKKYKTAMLTVARAFQEIKDAYQGSDAYKPICPPNGGYLLKLAPCSWVPDPGACLPTSAPSDACNKEAEGIVQQGQK